MLSMGQEGWPAPSGAAREHGTLKLIPPRSPLVPLKALPRNSPTAPFTAYCPPKVVPRRARKGQWDERMACNDCSLVGSPPTSTEAGAVT